MKRTVAFQGPTFPGLSLHLSKVHKYSENKIFWIYTIVLHFFLVHPLIDYFPVTALEAFLMFYFYSQCTKQETMTINTSVGFTPLCLFNDVTPNSPVIWGGL